MLRVLGRVVIASLVLLTWHSALWAQLGTANRDVLLRSGSSTSSQVMEHLPKGTRLMLIKTTARAGFYHVRTEDEDVGWVWAKFVDISQSPHKPGQPTIPEVSLTAHPGCDASLWSHVYHSQRLIVKQSCIEVTGTIVDATNGKQSDGVRHEADGDTHGWLKPDPQFENLLNAGNKSAEGGNLVFEIVCIFPVKQADAVVACKGYKNQITIPPVGSRVRIVGSYVQDTFHAQWMEIHPVTSITVIK
jgi:Bacterial SH3 domain